MTRSRLKNDFATGNVEISSGNLKLSSGNGVDFSSTSDASGASSELLDDYEEGTWSPSVTAGSISGTSINYLGKYVKVGNIVTLLFEASNSAGDIQISSYCAFGGLPFSLVRFATSTVITEDIDIFSRQGYAIAGSSLTIGKCGSSSGTTSIKCTLTTVQI